MKPKAECHHTSMIWKISSLPHCHITKCLLYPKHTHPIKRNINVRNAKYDGKKKIHEFAHQVLVRSLNALASHTEPLWNSYLILSPDSLFDVNAWYSIKNQHKVSWIRNNINYYLLFNCQHTQHSPPEKNGKLLWTANDFLHFRKLGNYENVWNKRIIHAWNWKDTVRMHPIRFYAGEKSRKT